MGTRCLTVVTSDFEGSNPHHHATIYRHWDGYPECHGQWLHDFLKGKKIVNGKGQDFDPTTHFNGPGRLASAIVAALIEDDHDPNLMEKGTVCGQEFEYHVHVHHGHESNSTLTLTVYSGPMTFFGGGGDNCNNKIFEGTVDEFGEYLTKLTEEQEA